MLNYPNFTKIRIAINQEKIYVLMLAFIFLFNVAVILTEKVPQLRDLSLESGQGAPEIAENSAATSAFGSLTNQEILDRLQYNSGGTVVIINLLSLGIMFIFGFGLFLDIHFLIARLQKRDILKTSNPYLKPGWGIADIFKLVVIFIFLGSIIHIIESYAFPGLKNLDFLPLLNTGIMDLAILAAIFYFVKVRYGQNLSAIGLKLNDWIKNLFLAVLSYIAFLPVLLIIVIAILSVAVIFKYQPPQQVIFKIFLNEQKPWFLIYSTIMVAVFGPFVEEVFFRAFTYNAIKKKLGIKVAMVLTTLIFAILHGNLFGFLPIAALGFLLVYMYEKTGSLVCPIAIHMLHNGIMVTFLFLGRYFIRMLAGS